MLIYDQKNVLIFLLGNLHLFPVSELFHTERTHVRVLKVLKHLFHLPMLEAGILSKEQSEMLFPNIEQILEIHTTFNQAMKKRREEEPLVIRVGDLLVNMVSLCMCRFPLWLHLCV